MPSVTGPVGSDEQRATQFSSTPEDGGIVTIRPPVDGVAAILIAGRDDEFHRWLGSGAKEPQPVGCIVVDNEIAGWVDSTSNVTGFPREESMSVTACFHRIAVTDMRRER
jgi:hypothetical protein